MPTYEYLCSSCNKQFEKLQSMNDKPIQECLHCGKTGKVRRLIGAGAGIIFKGSGFYSTDYRSSNKTDKTDSASSQNSSESTSSSSNSSSKSSFSGESSSNSSSTNDSTKNSQK